MQNADKELTDKLKECNNMDQVMDAVQNYYDFSHPFGIAQKILVISTIPMILKRLNLKKRNTNI